MVSRIRERWYEPLLWAGEEGKPSQLDRMFEPESSLSARRAEYNSPFCDAMHSTYTTRYPWAETWLHRPAGAVALIYKRRARTTWAQGLLHLCVSLQMPLLPCNYTHQSFDSGCSGGRKGNISKFPPLLHTRSAKSGRWKKGGQR